MHTASKNFIENNSILVINLFAFVGFSEILLLQRVTYAQNQFGIRRVPEKGKEINMLFLYCPPMVPIHNQLDYFYFSRSY